MRPDNTSKNSNRNKIILILFFAVFFISFWIGAYSRRSVPVSPEAVESGQKIQP